MKSTLISLQAVPVGTAQKRKKCTHGKCHISEDIEEEIARLIG